MHRLAKVGLVVLVALATTGGVLGGFERGNRLFRAGEYAEAVEEYRAALRAGDDSPTLRYNLGTALLELGRYDEAQEHLEAALSAVDPQLRQWVHYNLGQRFLEDARSSTDPRAGMGLYDAAVEAYRQALRLQPGDEDAKWNYELALRERQEQAQRQAGSGGEGEREQQPQEGDRGQGGGSEPRQSPQEPGEDQPVPQQGQGAPQPLTPEQAERILSGVEQDERELFRDKLRQGRQQTRAARDW